jgi:ubiquinone/menaquinone biosynthesis C-methylase UbiE
MIMTQSYNPKRALMAKIRGDYLHGGEEESVQLVLEQIKQLKKLGASVKILDVGSGLGCTANYFSQKNAGELIGIDVDPAAVEYASKKYPHIPFHVSNAMNVETILPQNYFDVLYIFNAFYAFNEQEKCLKALSRVAKSGALLVIFDYTHRDLSRSHGLLDMAGQLMRPIVCDNLRQWLTPLNWEIVHETDLSDQYEVWYQNVLDKMIKQKKELVKEFSKKTYDEARGVFDPIIQLLKEKVLGGTVVYARKM